MENMRERFMSASDVAEVLQVSKSTAYKLVREFNAELKEQGFLTIAGKVPREYFETKMYHKPA